MHSENTTIRNIQLSQTGVEVVGIVWWDGLHRTKYVSRAFRAKAVVKMRSATWESKAQATSIN